MRFSSDAYPSCLPAFLPFSQTISCKRGCSLAWCSSRPPHRLCKRGCIPWRAFIAPVTPIKTRVALTARPHGNPSISIFSLSSSFDHGLHDSQAVVEGRQQGHRPTAMATPISALPFRSLAPWGEGACSDTLGEGVRPTQQQIWGGVLFAPLALPGGDNRQLWPRGPFQYRQQTCGVWG